MQPTAFRPEAFDDDVPLLLATWDTGWTLRVAGRAALSGTKDQLNYFRAAHPSAILGPRTTRPTRLALGERETGVVGEALSRVFPDQAPVVVYNPTASNPFTRCTHLPKEVDNALSAAEHAIVLRRLVGLLPDHVFVLGASLKPRDVANVRVVREVVAVAGSSRVVPLTRLPVPGVTSIRGFAALLASPRVCSVTGSGTGTNTHLAALSGTLGFSIERGADPAMAANWARGGNFQMGSFRWRNPSASTGIHVLDWSARTESALAAAADAFACHHTTAHDPCARALYAAPDTAAALVRPLPGILDRRPARGGARRASCARRDDAGGAGALRRLRRRDGLPGPPARRRRPRTGRAGRGPGRALPSAGRNGAAPVRGLQPAQAARPHDCRCCADTRGRVMPRPPRALLRGSGHQAGPEHRRVEQQPPRRRPCSRIGQDGQLGEGLAQVRPGCGRRSGWRNPGTAVPGPAPPPRSAPPSGRSRRWRGRTRVGPAAGARWAREPVDLQIEPGEVVRAAAPPGLLPVDRHRPGTRIDAVQRVQVAVGQQRYGIELDGAQRALPQGAGEPRHQRDVVAERVPGRSRARRSPSAPRPASTFVAGRVRSSPQRTVRGPDGVEQGEGPPPSGGGQRGAGRGNEPADRGQRVAQVDRLGVQHRHDRVPADDLVADQTVRDVPQHPRHLVLPAQRRGCLRARIEDHSHHDVLPAARDRDGGEQCLAGGAVRGCRSLTGARTGRMPSARRALAAASPARSSGLVPVSMARVPPVCGADRWTSGAGAAMDPERTRNETRAITSAAAWLGLDTRQVRPVSQRRTGVYRVLVYAEAARQGFPAGMSVQAARVTTLSDSITPAHQTHRLVHDLHTRGAPVAAPRHRDIVATPDGEVGFWEWMEPAQVTARQWGRLTAAFHRSGAKGAHPPGRYHPATVFAPRLRRARELTSQQGHPLFGEHTLVRVFESALDAAVDQALTAAASVPAMLVLGDNQPGNVMSPPGGGPVLNDFERVAVGPAAVDLAALLLGLQHFGYPPAVAQEFLDGYGPGAPTPEQARPYARIRELSGAVIAMIQAGDSPEMEREMQVRAVAVTSPGAGDQWTFVDNPAAMTLAGVPAPQASTDEVPDARPGG